MRSLIGPLCLFVTAAFSSTSFDQQTTVDSQSTTGAGGYHQSQVYSGVNGTPYYVEPSRFSYNSPTTRVNSAAPMGRTYTFSRRTGRFPVYNYYQPNGRIAYRYGPYVYYPRVYYIAPGVTQHLGPFIPLR